MNLIQLTKRLAICPFCRYIKEGNTFNQIGRVVHIAEEATRKFITFIQQREISRPELDGALIGCISDWLVRGDGFEAVGGSYEVYLQTVLLIIEEWLKDPTLLDYRKPRRDGRQWRRRRRPDRILPDRDNRILEITRQTFNLCRALHNREF